MEEEPHAASSSRQGGAAFTAPPPAKPFTAPPPALRLPANLTPQQMKSLLRHTQSKASHEDPGTAQVAEDEEVHSSVPPGDSAFDGQAPSASSSSIPWTPPLSSEPPVGTQLGQQAPSASSSRIPWTPPLSSEPPVGSQQAPTGPHFTDGTAWLLKVCGPNGVGVDDDRPTYLWQHHGDLQLYVDVEALLGDFDELSRECDQLFVATVLKEIGASFCEKDDHRQLRLLPERLHPITQRLIDCFGVRSESVLDRIGMVYSVLAENCSAGLGVVEFRGYIASVLTQVTRELETRSDVAAMVAKRAEEAEKAAVAEDTDLEEDGAPEEASVEEALDIVMAEEAAEKARDEKSAEAVTASEVAEATTVEEADCAEQGPEAAEAEDEAEGSVCEDTATDSPDAVTHEVEKADDETEAAKAPDSVMAEEAADRARSEESPEAVTASEPAEIKTTSGTAEAAKAEEAESAESGVEAAEPQEVESQSFVAQLEADPKITAESDAAPESTGNPIEEVADNGAPEVVAGAEPPRPGEEVESQIPVAQLEAEAAVTAQAHVAPESTGNLAVEVANDDAPDAAVGAEPAHPVEEESPSPAAQYEVAPTATLESHPDSAGDPAGAASTGEEPEADATEPLPAAEGTETSQPADEANTDAAEATQPQGGYGSPKSRAQTRSRGRGRGGRRKAAERGG